MATASDLQPACGDEASFRTLVEPCLGPAYRVALLILLDRDLARDAVQEALLRAYRGLGKLRAGSNFGAWFNRLAVNEARRLAGRRQRQPVLLEQLPEIATAPWESPEEHLLAREDRTRLWAALAELDELYRTVLVLRYYQGLTDTEIAEALAIPPGTVKSRLHAARQRLHDRLTRGDGAMSWGDRLRKLVPGRVSR
ncbi:MAG: polymerase ECF-type sigma factor [Symbiobacteriaceae bacterium]|nr:polymerase ECF-type sigma factor [Symbiobacteriaceae bacterium]